MDWKPEIFIYHSPCDDGFGAAWAVWQRYGDGVAYVPASYGKPAPDVSGKHVLIGDFSFKRAVLDEMAQTARSIVILDHHKTAEEDLAPFKVELCGSAKLSAAEIPGMLRDLAELGRPPIIALFDMEKSGARMCWEFCHPDQEVPLLIRHVEDRDLWRFALPATRGLSLYLRSHPYDFMTWRRIANELADEGQRNHVNFAAASIEAFYDQKVGEMVREAKIEVIDGNAVPVVNCS